MLISDDAARDSLFDGLLAFQAAWPARGWSWDNRFECLASTIAFHESVQALATAKALCPLVWDGQQMGGAPKLVRDVAAATGGVRSDQLLLAAQERAGLLMFGLWWPWGGESSNISMRLGLAGNHSNDELTRLRALFRAIEG